MDRKFIVFLVFVSATQNSVLLSSAHSYGFPQKDVSRLDLSSSNFIDAKNELITGFSSFFYKLLDIIGNNTSYQADRAPRNFTADFSPSLVKLADAVQLTFNSTLLIGGESCAGIGTGINGDASAIVAKIFANTLKSLELAEAGDDENNKRQIANNQYSTDTDAVKLVDTLFSSIRCCANDNRQNVEDLIRHVQGKVTGSLIKVVNITYEAIEFYSRVATGARNPNGPAILISSNIGQAAVQEEGVSILRHIFALIDTLLIEEGLDRADILDVVYRIRLTQKVVTYNLLEAVKVAYKMINNNLLQLPERALYSFNNTLNLISGRVIKALNAHLSIIRITHPESTRKVNTVQSFAPRVLISFVKRYLKAIEVADDGTLICPENSAAISMNEKVQDKIIKAVLKILFALIPKDPNTADRIGTTISKLKKSAITHAQMASRYILHVINTAAELRCSKKNATKKDVTDILKSELATFPEIGEASERVATENLIQVLATAGILPGN